MSDAAPPPSPPRSEPWTATALRVLVHAITAGVIAYPLTVPDGVVAAALGSGTGALLARSIAGSPLRIPTILLGGLGGLVGMLVLRLVVVDLAFVPALLGPSGALKLGDAVVFGLGGLAVSSVLRSVSTRRPALSVLEAALVAGGFATLLVSHRNGSIHRPYELADPLIARGEDPALAVLLIGAGGAVVIGMLLLSERSLVRSAVHLGVVAALLVAILLTTTMEGLPTPPPSAGALGLQDDDREARGGGQGSGEGQGRRDTDELEFRDQAPSGSPAPDAVVLFHEDYPSPLGYYYFRQGAFSQYNGRKLVAALREDVDRDVRNLFPTNRSREVGWVPAAGADRMSVETTVAMLSENAAPLGLEAPTRFVPATNPNPQRFRRLYRAHSNALTADYDALLGRPVGDPTWTDEVRALYLSGPEDPRYRELALRIVHALPEELRDDPVARALAINQYLGANGTYSLRSRHAGHEDPTAHFLFGDLTGYCVHFAHAAVYLMRAAGVPARVATGYAVAEANRQGGSALLLRNSDQHAWPEVYVGAPPLPPPVDLLVVQLLRDSRVAGDLETLDLETMVDEELRLALSSIRDTAVAQHGLVVTPLHEARLAQVRDGQRAELELAALAREAGQTPAALIDATIARLTAEPRPTSPDAGWVVMDVAPENVLDPPGEPPDPALQQLLAEMARGSQPLDDAPQPPRPMAELVRQARGPLVSALLGLVSALFALALGAKLWRGLAPRFVAEPRVIYRAALDRLSESGLSRRWGESPEAFAARVQRAVPALGPLTSGHLAAAFGRHRDPARVGSMMGAYRALLGELRRAVPWWRRALGLVNPFSWLLTR